MFMKILIIMLISLYLIFNVVVAMTHTTKQMKRKLDDERSLLDKVFLAMFYAPAWVLKGIKIAIIALIA